MRRAWLAMLLLVLPASPAGAAWQTQPPGRAALDQTGMAVSAAGERISVYEVPWGSGNQALMVSYPSASNSLTSHRVVEPFVASGGGTTLVAWRDAAELYLAERPDGGDFGSMSDQNALVAADVLLALRMNSHGDAALLFARNEAGGSRLYLAVRPAGAPQFGTPVAVSGAIPGSTPQAAMALSASRRIAIGWVDGGAVDAVLGSVTGGPGAVQKISDPGAPAARPWMAADDAGDAILTWVESHGDGTKGVVWAAVAPAGGGFGAPQYLRGAADAATGARVAVNGAGDAVVAWSQTYLDSTDRGAAEAVTFRLPAGTPPSPTRLSQYAATAAGAVPALAPDGSAVVVFQDLSNNIEAARRPAGGPSFSAAEDVACAAGVIAPGDAVFVAGRPSFMWVQTGDRATVNRADFTDSGTPPACSRPAAPAPDGGYAFLNGQPIGGYGGPGVPVGQTTHGSKPDAPLLTGPIAYRLADVIAAGGATSSGSALRAGTLTLRWILRGDHPVVVAIGSVPAGAHDPVAIPLTLTARGRALLETATATVSLREQLTLGSGAAQRVTQRSITLAPAVDRCAQAPVGVRCQAGLLRRTPGGKALGKVSHRGWPAIDGLLWIVDHRGRSGSGTELNDELLGGHGSDTLRGLAGDDVLWGDEWPTHNNATQRDALYGGAGNDWLYASHGPNVLSGGTGDDTIWSVYAVRAVIVAGPGNDRIVARRGHGSIDCGPGRDTVWVPRHRYRLRGCEDVRHGAPQAILGL